MSAAFLALTVTSTLAVAQKKYDTGATDTEIRIGNIMPYSGALSTLSAIGKIEALYFKKINDDGGINGRKINFISYDDAYSPPKTVEQTRKLVESDEVLLIFSTLGTPTNAAIQKYLNGKKVPQLFIGTGATRWNDPKTFPWTMAWQPSYQSEGRIYAKYILEERPNAKIAVIYQNDDFGKDYLKGLKDGLGAKVSLIVAEESYETSEPTIDSHILNLRAKGADVFVNIALPKFAAQGIKKAAEIGWKPLHIVPSVTATIGGTLKPAGFEHSQGIISAFFVKDGADRQWDSDKGMRDFYAFLAKYAPDADKTDYYNVYGYGAAQAMVHVLQQCGDNLTRENVMKQAASLNGFASGVLLPGITANTSTTDYAPMKQLQLMRFKGENWELFGSVLSGDPGG
jgi:branched-chain amino acid transport system substrate-binding protein